MTTMGIIFANIYDSSLGELTNKRTMASLPYGGRYRQVDFSLSNMSNSGIRHIGIITKHNYHSLMNHIGSGQEWDLDLEEGGLEFLTPFAADSNASYRGKLEALNSAINVLKSAKEEYVVMADSGVLCAIDFDELLQAHITSGADITVAVKDGICNGKKQVDMAVKMQPDGFVTDIAVDYCADGSYLASMGIFVIRREELIRQVTEAVARSRYRLERDMVLYRFATQEWKVNAYRFGGIALFNESTAEYYHNNLALLNSEVRCGLFRRPNRTIYTKVRDEVPSYYGVDAEVDDCMMADGCRIEGKANHSVFFRNVTLEKNARIDRCIVMQDCVIGEGSELDCVILDKDVVVRPGTKLRGTFEHPLVIKRGEII